MSFLMKTFRGPIAEREGLHAAFGFPILLGGEVLGVIEFFSREIRQPDQELLNVLATIGSQIGQFIERRRAERGLSCGSTEAKPLRCDAYKGRRFMGRKRFTAFGGLIRRGVFQAAKPSNGFTRTTVTG